MTLKVISCHLLATVTGCFLRSDSGYPKKQKSQFEKGQIFLLRWRGGCNILHVFQLLSSFMVLCICGYWQNIVDKVDAVNTNILLKAWLCLWTSVPSFHTMEILLFLQDYNLLKEMKIVQVCSLAFSSQSSFSWLIKLKAVCLVFWLLRLLRSIPHILAPP